MSRSYTYHKNNPGYELYLSEVTLDETGKEKGLVNEFGKLISEYEYQKDSDLLISETYKGSKKVYGYTQDYLTSLKHNNFSYKYEYDSNLRLKREDNKKLNKTIVYNYDKGGNITSRRDYEYTLENVSMLESERYLYQYSLLGNRDRLKSYNGELIEYDELGNPIIYRDKNLVWDRDGKNMFFRLILILV